MIIRQWHGWTTPENAQAYETLLREDIFPAIRQKVGDNLHSTELLQRELEEEVEFLVVIRFASLDAVKAMAGEDYEVAFIPDAARQLLKRFDERARHFELRYSSVPGSRFA